MPASSPIAWTELFASDQPPDLTLRFNVLKKSGRPFLMLPGNPGLAALAMGLYPAQHFFARMAKKLITTAWRLKIPFGLNHVSVPISRANPFCNFLMKLAGTESNAFPDLAILAGNARVEGRRFIILVFNELQQPALVVKAGIGASARRLILKEQSFLQSIPEEIRPLPKIISTFASETMDAFSLAYVAGDSPTGQPWAAIGDLLQGWINRRQRVQITALPSWRALEKKGSTHPLYPRLSARFDGFECHPVLFHGDFAPWNLKVSQGAWTVLDWERGELTGLPGWDWFHYVTQTGILVEKLPARELKKNLEALLHDPSFKKYAVAAGILEKEKELLIAYLFYLVEIIRPTEGLESAKTLLDLLGAEWLAKS